MNYNTFLSGDFIKDEYFQQWVLSPDEGNDAFWKAYMAQHPHQQKEIDEAREFLLMFNLKGKDVLESKISNLKKRIDFTLDQGEGTGPTYHAISPVIPVARPPRYRMYAAAASVSVILMCSVVFYWVRRSDAVFVAGMVELVTKKGQRSLVTLQDGTKVWLNADSELKYPKTFSGEKFRDVYLEGEAYFDVAENKEHPFIVHTSDISVKVLGTAFNVRSYPMDNIVETTLVRGKVNIASTGKQAKQITLLPNQKVVFEKQSRKLLLENRVNTEKYVSWREGTMMFEDQSLREIVQALERWYNVTIKVEDANSMDCHFSAKINNKSLEEVLELFKASDNIDYKIEGDKVLIQGKLCE